MKNEKKANLPVFFDPNKTRWPKVKLGMLTLGVVFSLVFIFFAISIVLSPVLPNLNLPIIGHVNTPLKAPDKNNIAQDKRYARLKNHLHRLSAHKQSARSPKAMLRMSYYVNWDDTALASLKKNLSSLDVVVGEFLHLQGSDGSINEDDVDRSQAAIDYIKNKQPNTKIFALINNYQGSGWQQDLLGKMLGNQANRQKAITSIKNYLIKEKLQGVSIDFENIAAKDQGNYDRFLEELSIALHANNLLVMTNVPASDDNFDYPRIAKAVDYVTVMAYDEHWSTGTPGPIASMDWFDSVVADRSKDIPQDKLIVAIANYAYDWQDGHEAAIKTFEEAILTAKEFEGTVSLDAETLNSEFSYTDDSGAKHQVWMMDAISSFNELASIDDYQPAGVALWRLGAEDPSTWSVFNTENLNQAAADTLKSIYFDYELDYKGQGEILKVSATPQAGARDLHFDAERNYITTAQYTSFPSPYVINRYGYAPKKLALTFDDGPDPEYTPAILDILKKENVKGTFFIIGNNGEKYPEILKRMVDEGHDVGSHTFTHPNIAEISQTQLRLELSATERLLESTTGRGTHLFRSPYAEDSEPDTKEQVKPVEYINSLGYITVGMLIDPNDWRAPGVNKIIDATVKAADAGKGNVILLHDSGGDRSQTVAALPILIKQLKAKGYQLVGVSDLLGKSRDEVMPLAPKTDKMWRWSDALGFGLLDGWSKLMGYLFLLGIFLGLSRLLFIIILAIYQKFKHRPPQISAETKLPSLAVIVPAYNEAKVINRTIASLLASNHPDKFEIVIVDDGSTDDTLQVVRSEYGHHEQVKIISVPNGGKPNALNRGLEETKAEVVVTLDADTVFAKDTLLKLVRYFQDAQVAAVAGNAKVGNRLNLMTRWQALEYIISQNLDRRALVVLNAITVVPGAVGAWRRQAVLEAGGFTSDTLAEDADLTIAVRALGYKIVYEDEAIALTEAPDTVKTFLRQRYRWMFGTLQVGWKHRQKLFKSKYGWLGFFSLPNIFIYQIFFPLISPLMDLMMLWVLIKSGWQYWQHPLEFSAGGLHQTLFYYALFLLVDYVTGIIAFLMEKKEDKKLLIWLLPQRFFYRQLMYYAAIKSVMSSLRGGEVGWNKLERKGTIKDMGE